MFFVNKLKNFTFAVILSEGVIMSAAKNLFPEFYKNGQFVRRKCQIVSKLCQNVHFFSLFGTGTGIAFPISVRPKGRG